MQVACEKKKVCTFIKYICVDELEQVDCYLGIACTEKRIERVIHSDFEDLHDKVFKAAPDDYVCTEPIALYHEVLWNAGLKAVGGILVRDELHHALEEWEYGMLGPGKAHKDWKKRTPLSLCVDIVKSKGAKNGAPPTSSGPPSAARPAALASPPARR